MGRRALGRVQLAAAALQPLAASENIYSASLA